MHNSDAEVFVLNDMTSLRMRVKIAMMETLFIPLLLFALPGLLCQDYCRFPQYMWGRQAGSLNGTWITRTLYSDNLKRASSYQEIVVKRTVIETWSCASNGSSSPCETKELVENMQCLTEEAGGKLRVQIRRDTETWFACIKFWERQEGIVQVEKSVPAAINVDTLCFDKALVRNPWPWMIPSKQSWNYLPFEGGYNFRAFVDGQKKMCRHQWRPSRMESECIRGEGLRFSFPESSCSFFPGSVENIQLYSRGSWEEQGQVFLLLGEAASLPRYTLVYPRDLPNLIETEATLYLHAVTPLSDDFESPDIASLKAVHLQLSKTIDSEVCYDEGPECESFARKGWCTSESWHKYASFCKKSCGLCGFVPSMVSECEFPEAHRGEWLMVASDAIERVAIGAGNIAFSSLGSFICKSKHWSRDLFKMMSVYKNGCRPKFTCLQFRRSGRALLYRMSQSNAMDRSFGLCAFVDDPSPLKDRIRSADYKVLLPKEHAHEGCGLSGWLHVNITYPDGTKCEGSISDWNTKQCTAASELTLENWNCRKDPEKKFTCIVSVDMSADTKVVITQDANKRDSSRRCWLVTTRYNKGRWGTPWLSGYFLDHSQCGANKDFGKVNSGSSEMAVHSVRGNLNRVCENGGSWVRPETSSVGARSTRPFAPTHPSHTPGSNVMAGAVRGDKNAEPKYVASLILIATLCVSSVCAR
ncbi:hypothetical protein CAPTEDRAFT_227924 [Capitella teleta]|uniref:ShKT domain-containing protein n=1 Tax=Capitella teleta TaxID=283909 RepID=R7TKQ2_CAPTE|nr:hypothetical protein CAPTEDRAFT_227924 [Capitella teleta]|eukprot:ELT94274.1 hypothetical protein CAPTEDRAFT_227924 [Capitella teleta]